MIMMLIRDLTFSAHQSPCLFPSCGGRRVLTCSNAGLIRTLHERMAKEDSIRGEPAGIVHGVMHDEIRGMSPVAEGVG